MDERKLPGYFDKFISYLDEKGFTPYSQKMSIIGVKTFYHTFEIKTPNKTVSGVPQSYYMLYDDLPQYNAIRKIISLSNVQYRALFSFMASSAMNYSDATSISARELILAVNYYFKITKQEDYRVNNLKDIWNTRKS